MTKNQQQSIKKSRLKYLFTAGLTASMLLLTSFLLLLTLKKVAYNWKAIAINDWGEIAFFLALTLLFFVFTIQFKKQYQTLKNDNS